MIGAKESRKNPLVGGESGKVLAGELREFVFAHRVTRDHLAGLRHEVRAVLARTGHRQVQTAVDTVRDLLEGDGVQPPRAGLSTAASSSRTRPAHAAAAGTMSCIKK